MNTLQEMKEIIEAAIAGMDIQYKYYDESWRPCKPVFNFHEFTYRIKPEPKPDVVRRVSVIQGGTLRSIWCCSDAPDNLQLTFDGETGELKSAEVLKP